MYKLDIDLKSYIPYAIEAYTAVLGSEYAEYIAEKISKVVVFYYKDPDGIKNYTNYLKDCKKHELACRFLEEIGVEVPDDVKENYTISFDEETCQILDDIFNKANEADEEYACPHPTDYSRL